MARAVLATRVRALFIGRSGEYMLALAVQLFGAGLAYLNQLVLARVLSASGYGRLSAIVSVSTIAGLVVTLGVGGLGVRYLPARLAAGDHRSRDVYIGFAYRVTLVVSIGTGFLGGCLAFALGMRPWSIIVVTAALCVVTALWNLGSDLGRAVGRFAVTYGASVVLRPALGIGMVFLCYLILPSVEPLEAIAALVLGGLCVVVIQMSVLGGETSWPRILTARDERSSGWLREAPPYMLASAVTLVLLQTDMLVSSVILSAADLGRYAAAVKSVQVLSIVTGAVGTVISPRIARAAGDRAALSREARSATLWGFVGITAAGLALFVAAPLVLGFFGNDFRSATWVVRVLVVGQVVNAAFGPGGTLLVYSGKPQVATAGYSACIFVSAIGCGIGAELWGLDGAAAGSALGVATAGLVMWALARRYAGVGGSLLSVARF